MQERRQNVRVRPTGDYNVRIDSGSGNVKVQLSVVNAAAGGVVLVLEELIVGTPTGADIRLGIPLPGVPRFETVGRIRYIQGRGGGRCGLHSDKLREGQQVALSRAVSELLERGLAV